MQMVGAHIFNNGIMDITIEKPAGWDRTFRAGMCAYINIPEVSRWEWHPFSLTSCRSDPFIRFHIRTCGDWTQSTLNVIGDCCVSTGLLSKEYSRNEDAFARALSRNPLAVSSRVFARNPTPFTIRSCFNLSDPSKERQVFSREPPMIRVEGPIGTSSQGFRDHSVVVLIGAGIGVTPMISVLQDILHAP